LCGACVARGDCYDEFLGLTVPHGERYFPLMPENPCYECICERGEASNCRTLQCQDREVCADGRTVPYRVEGECCLVCPEDSLPRPGQAVCRALVTFTL
jgi:hypothetical protein